MNASSVVNNLLENDLPPEDAPSAEYTGGDPGRLLAGVLRDELVEKGWRNIRITNSAEDLWDVEAGFVDWLYRSEWLAAGARVAPSPEDTLQLRGRIMNMFRAACRRAKVEFRCELSRLTPQHDDYDLHTDYGDFENDPGDWRVEIALFWTPLPGFWSKASAALGYEDKPYQKNRFPS